MMHRPLTLVACLASLVASLAAGCGNSAGSDVLGGSLSVSGEVHDFQTGAVVSGDITIGTSALIPEPTVSTEGATYVLDHVPEYSAFEILAGVSGSHRATYNATTEVTDSDLDGVVSYAVSEMLVSSLATAFGATPMDTHGIVLMQLVDASGNPKANVAASNIVLSGVTGIAPKFLDASLAPAPSLTASSTSGWTVIFNVPPGVVTLAAAATATATLAAPTAPVAAGMITLVRATVTDGMAPALPTNISFANQIVPIFSARGCIGCHSGNGPGKDLGGLQLDGGVMKVYKELVEEDPTRANPAMPEKSLVLTMPSKELPSDSHPNVTFTGPQDPDYIKILVWLREGAKNN
jgi:hypothetical protein